MIPFDNDCPENMEDIEQVKVSTKDYCVDIPLNRKVLFLIPISWIPFILRVIPGNCMYVL